jgi:hypothetical protein
MNRLLIALILIVACVAGLGFYQKWFSVASDSADGKSHITLTMDKDKMKKDETQAVKKMQDMEHVVKDKTMGPTEKSKDEASPGAELPQTQK